MNKTQKYHFIGIGGIGMSALARILLSKEISVSGSDLSLNEITDQLVKQGATIYKGHSEHHIVKENTIVFNSQIQKNNPEYLTALELKCPILHRSELLALLMSNTKSLTVAGTHGKTTTSSLLVNVLTASGGDPSFAIGGLISGVNGKLGKGEYFVAEADESDGSLLNYLPEGAILTNLEAEHLDYYKNEQILRETFQIFIKKIQNDELLFYCGDEEVLSSLVEGKGTSYGFKKTNDLCIENYEQNGWDASFDVTFENKLYPKVQLALIGKHNALNAAAVFGLCLRLGISENAIRFALKTFPGISRRCEKKGEKGGVLFLDDYGHHPTEIRTTLHAVKNAIQERRLVVLFQPHRYTRTKELMHAFSTAFEDADDLYITDVYAAHEESIDGIHAQALVELVHKNSTIPCHYLPQKNGYAEVLNELQVHDVLLTLGAGNITNFHAELPSTFSPKKMRIGLVFGGRSCEHEISLRSCKFVTHSLNRSLYEISFLAIDKQGKWVVGDEAEMLLHTHTVISSKNALSITDPLVSSALENCDLFLPILHGTYGEDGTLQGFFETLDKPYAGPDYRSAAICMDKVLTKRIAEKNGIPTPKDITFGHHSWLHQKEEKLKEICASLVFPVYVKPVHLGSSVGITFVDLEEKLETAIDYVFRFDTQVMIEEGKMNCRELEFAVLGNTHSFSVIAPAPGEKLAEGFFVDYEKKYGQITIQTTLEAKMPLEILEKGKKLAKKAYEAIGCTGMTRVDFLLDSHGEFWLFEMNSIPGLQQFSLFPKIWQREGVSAEHLFDRLVILALERYHKQKRHYKCLS